MAGGQQYFRDIEIIGGKIYAATCQASKGLTVFDVQYGNGCPSYRAERLVMLEPTPVSDMTRNGVTFYRKREFISLASDSLSGELFVIFWRTNFALETIETVPWSVFVGGNFVIPPQTQAFRVIKMEWNIDGSWWVEVFDLGDRILFVAMGGNKLISTSNCLDHNDLHGKKFERNCIYFAFHKLCLASPSVGRDFRVFSLINRSIKLFAFPKEDFLTKLYSRPVWFIPKSLVG